MNAISISPIAQLQSRYDPNSMYVFGVKNAGLWARVFGVYVHLAGEGCSS